MRRKIELMHIEIWEYCMLNIMSGRKKFYKEKKYDEFTGLYFRNKNVFFAIYPTTKGPIMYYEKKEYPLRKDLNISVKKMGDWREFRIEEYDIHIKYPTSKYIGFDVWSEEKDVDLFYQIATSYQDDEYYQKFTK